MTSTYVSTARAIAAELLNDPDGAKAVSVLAAAFPHANLLDGTPVVDVAIATIEQQIAAATPLEPTADDGWTPTSVLDNMLAPDPIGDLEQRIRAEVIAIVEHHSRNSARSLQKRIGPSEIGEECDRQLTYKLLGWDEVNTDSDPWPSFVGTAGHAALEQAFASPHLQGRYLTEVKLDVDGSLSGTGDVYDRELKVVLDHKLLGNTKMQRIRKRDIGSKYRVQLHAYGLGVRNTLGEDPTHIALLAYPRGGMIRGKYGLEVIVEPWDASIAQNALKRRDVLVQIAMALDLESAPSEVWEQVKATESMCEYCPFYRAGSTDLRVACPGMRRCKDCGASAEFDKPCVCAVK